MVPPKRRLNILVVLSVMIATVCVAPNGAFANSPISLEYQVTILRPENRLVHVNLRVSNVDSGTVTFGRGQTGGFPPREVPAARNLAAKNQSGYPLNLKLSGSTNRFIETVVVVCNGSVVLLEYDVDLLPRTQAEVNWYLDAEFGVVEPEYLFLFPIDLQKDSYMPVSGVRVRFSLPSGWSVLTHWTKVDDYYEARTSDEVLWGSLGFGRFNCYTKKISNVEVTLAFYGYDLPVQQAVSKDIFRIYEYFSQMMGDVSSAKRIPRNKYLLIYVPKIQRRSVISNKEGAYGYFSHIEYPYRKDPSDWYWISWQAHMMLHEWNPSAFFGAPMWFSEGFTTYYQYKSTRDLELISQRQYESAIFARLKWYVEKVLGTSFDKSLVYAGSHAWEAETIFRINYYKSCLVAYLLDNRITYVTQGRRTLDTVMRYLFENHALTGKRLSSESILEAVNSVTGSDFTPFFEKYVYGTDRLPVRWADDRVEVIVLQMPALKVITTLELQLPQHATVGDPIVVKATLRTLLGEPLSNQTINFYLNDNSIGSARTDVSGIAMFSLLPGAAGTVRVTGSYEGSENHIKTEQKRTLMVSPKLPIAIAFAYANWPYLAGLIVAVICVIVMLVQKRSREKA